MVNRNLGNIPVPKPEYRDPALIEMLDDTTAWCHSQQLNAQQAIAFAENIRLLQEYEKAWAHQRRLAMRAWKNETPSPSRRSMAKALGITEPVVTRLLNRTKGE